MTTCLYRRVAAARVWRDGRRSRGVGQYLDMPRLTIVHVLENALDGDLSATRVEQLSQREIDDLYDAVNLFYEEWEGEAPQDALLRVHLGGWIARMASAGLARDLLNSALLYAHEVVIYDPVAAYFEPRRHLLRKLPIIKGAAANVDGAAVNQEATAGYIRFKNDLAAHRSHLGLAVEQVAALAPLIKQGVALPVPHLRLTLARQEQIFTAVRHLLRDEDYIRVVSSPVDRPAITQDDGPNVHIQVRPRTKADQRLQHYGDPAYYLARTLALAEASHAAYLPPSATEWAIYEQRLRMLGKTLQRRDRLELTVAPAIVASEVPYLTGLSPATLLAARADGEAFEMWRRALRRATRVIQASPADGQAFVDEARQILEDELTEVASEVQRETQKSRVLARSLRSHSLTIATSVAGVGVAAAAFGAAPAGLVGPVAGGLLKWVADTLLPPQLQGTKAVLANFVHHTPRYSTGGEGADDGWPIREGVIFEPKR